MTHSDTQSGSLCTKSIDTHTIEPEPMCLYMVVCVCIHALIPHLLHIARDGIICPSMPTHFYIPARNEASLQANINLVSTGNWTCNRRKLSSILLSASPNRLATTRAFKRRSTSSLSGNRRWCTKYNNASTTTPCRRGNQFLVQHHRSDVANRI